jgi:hypothetical protein
MARVAFTLRRTGLDRGSYARYDPDTYNTAASAGNAIEPDTWPYDEPYGTRDVDQALKSTGYLLPPNEFAESFLEAVAVAYGVVEINWGVNFPDEELGATPIATSAVLVYSPDGTPVTVSSGTTLADSSTNFFYEQRDLEEGRWAYYTLFIKYQDFTSTYFEPVASVEVIVPYNYGSTQLLWNRLPQYYRESDIGIGEEYDPTSDFALTDIGGLPVGNVIGPLYRYLSIFGFEMDRVRTLVDYQMVSRDPAESNSETLDALAATMGVGLDTTTIAPERLRSIMDDIGYLRQTKGTLEGTGAYGRAFSGAEFLLNQADRSIKFYAQRVNYISDPLNASGLIAARPAHESEATRPLLFRGTYDPNTYVAGDVNTYPPLLSSEDYLSGMYWTASASAASFNGVPVDTGDYIVAYSKDGAVTFGVSGYSFDADNYDSFSTFSYTPFTVNSDTDVSYTYNGTGDAAGVTHVLFRLNSPVPVQLNDRVVFSIHSAIGTGAMKWVRLTTKSGDIVGWSNGTTKAGDSVAGEAQAVDNLGGALEVDGYTPVIIEFLVDLSAVDQFQLKYLLAERNHIGEYFDGSYVRGGWILDPSGNRSGDFAWSVEGDNFGGFSDGTPFRSVSVYTEDYQRTRSLLESYFRNYLPITQKPYYTMGLYNCVPGMDAVDYYYDSFWKFRTASDTTATGDSANVDGSVIYTAEATGTSDECATYLVEAANYDDNIPYDSGRYDSTQRSGGYNENGITYNEADSIYRNNGTCFPSAGYNEAEIVYNDPNINYPERGS